MAAGEDQPQPVVLDDAGRLVGAVVSDHECRLVLGVAVGLAADPVDRAVAGGRGEPAAGVGRYAVPGPPLDRGEERLAGRLLGDVDVAEAADQRGDDPAVLLAVDPLDRGRGIRRVHPAVRPPEARAGRAGPRPCPRRPSRPRSPTAGRRRGPGSSRIQKPPIHSLDSANGPSVTIGSAPVLSTVVDDLDRLEAPAEHPDAGVLHLLVDAVHGLEDRLHRPPCRTRSGRRRCRAR